MTRKRQIRFSSLFILLALTTLLVPGIIGGIYNTIQLNTKLTEHSNRENALALEIVAERLVHFFREPELELNILKVILSDDDETVMDFSKINSSGYRLRYFERLTLVDANQTIADIWPYDNHAIGLSQKGTGYLDRLQRSGKADFWSNTYVDYATGNTAIDLIAPFGNGYIFGTVILSDLQSLIESSGEFIDSSIGIVDNGGSYLAHTDSAMVDQRMKDPLLYLEDTTALSGKKIQLNGSDYLIYAKRFESTGWTIVSYFPESAARDTVTDVLLNFTLIQTVTLLVMILLITLSIQAVNKKILQVQQFTQMIALGNYDIKEPESIFYEASNIVSDFESMASLVQQRESEIIAQNQEIMAMNEELESRVAQRTQQLEEANRELEDFSYTVSHDLRAPLRHITGFMDMLVKRLPDITDEKSLHYISVIQASAGNMAQLIDDLLSFSKMGRSEMMHRTVDTSQLVERIVDAMGTELSERCVRWEIGPLESVRGDEEMLRLVWVNLLSNAVKYSSKQPEARIEIAMCTDADTPEGYVQFFVRDNGAGFDMRYSDKLFSIFQRLHKQDDFEGTGVGLANVKRIINRHGGTIWAQSQLNHGATFYFTLPKTRGTDNE